MAVYEHIKPIYGQLTVSEARVCDLVIVAGREPTVRVIEHGKVT
jgi:hypothetical protein